MPSASPTASPCSARRAAPVLRMSTPAATAAGRSAPGHARRPGGPPRSAGAYSRMTSSARSWVCVGHPGAGVGDDLHRAPPRRPRRRAVESTQQSVDTPASTSVASPTRSASCGAPLAERGRVHGRAGSAEVVRHSSYSGASGGCSANGHCVVVAPPGPGGRLGRDEPGERHRVAERLDQPPRSARSTSANRGRGPGLSGSANTRCMSMTTSHGADGARHPRPLVMPRSRLAAPAPPPGARTATGRGPAWPRSRATSATQHAEVGVRPGAGLAAEPERARAGSPARSASSAVVFVTRPQPSAVPTTITPDRRPPDVAVAARRVVQLGLGVVAVAQRDVGQHDARPGRDRHARA